MGGDATLTAARPERLRWLEPPPALRAEFPRLRARLEALVVRGGYTPLYAASRRRLYRVEDPELGAVGIKEMRNRSALRRLWFGWLAEHPAVGEYRIGIEFEARGGRTASFLGAALERGRLGLDRVLLFMRWMNGAVTLTRYLADRPGPPAPRLIATLARQVVAAARVGLVHGRHSSNNLLVVEREGEPVLHTIDFPHARLAAGLDRAGLARDTARIARWILHERLWPREAATALFAAVAAEACPEPGHAPAFAAQMERELEHVLRIPSRRHPPRA